MKKKLFIIGVLLSLSCIKIHANASTIDANALELVNIAKSAKVVIATAESCTGGMISAAITSIPGSSTIFKYGFITYSNEAKEKILNVKKETLNNYDAVSENVVREMAAGALANSGANIAIAITGIAGPSGGTDITPVGTVYIAIATHNETKVTRNSFSGDRDAIRMFATEKALQLCSQAIQKDYNVKKS